MKTKKKAGGLKKPGPNQKGLKKLPEAVRNKMGYMKAGGIKYMKDGGMKLTALQKKKMEGMTEEEKKTFLQRIKAATPKIKPTEPTETPKKTKMMMGGAMTPGRMEKKKKMKKGGPKKKKMTYMKNGGKKKMMGGGMKKMNDMYRTGGFIRPTFDIDTDVCCE
tara:strand:- start:868 stop:1356 length:489 start_codon:yes stop_codon:yes gene_type:complete